MFKNIKRIKLFGQIFEQRDKIILRDYLALERTKLANERTFLAYLRTSLYMLLGGIAILQLTGFENIRWIGFASLGISVLLIVIGIIRYSVIRTRLTRYYQEASGDKQEKRPE